MTMADYAADDRATHRSTGASARFAGPEAGTPFSSRAEPKGAAISLPAAEQDLSNEDSSAIVWPGRT